jgi:hypothetical protein
MTTRIDRDPDLRAALVGVAAMGVLISVATGLAFDQAALFGVAVGAALALSNLWALERLVHLYSYSSTRAWAGVAALKLLVLLGIVFLLLTRNVVGLLPLVVGYGALPAGIVVSRLRPVPPPVREKG